MSHIDSFQHMIAGYFVGLPVYRPLEDIDGEFQCTTKQVVVGGGSGEHPALIIKNPLAAVARFLSDQIDHLNLNRHARDKWKNIFEPYVTSDDAKIIEFCNWDAETHERFYKRCKSDILENSYKIYEEEISLEEWLILGFGEFFFFSMPEIVPEIVSNLTDPYKPFHHVRYNNILLIPPNMPVYANGGNAYISTLRTQ